MLLLPTLAVLPFHFGFFATGPLDAITDVAGVRVGHTTLNRGTNIRTGVTAILPTPETCFARRLLGRYLSAMRLVNWSARPR